MAAAENTQAPGDPSESQTTRSMINRFMERIGIRHPMPAKDARTIIDEIEDNRRLNEVVCADDEETALAYLYTKTFGKAIDCNYYAYCATLMNEYFIENKVISYKDRRRILKTIIPKHIVERAEEDACYTYESIQRIKEYNDEIKGTIERWNPYFPWVKQTIHLDTKNLNAISLSPRRESYNWKFIAIASIATLGGMWTVSYFASRLFSKITNGFITPSPQKLLALPSTTDTTLSCCQSTTQRVLETAKDISRNLLSRIIHILKPSTACPCPTTTSEMPTFVSLIRYKLDHGLEAIFNRSPR